MNSRLNYVKPHVYMALKYFWKLKEIGDEADFGIYKRTPI